MTDGGPVAIIKVQPFIRAENSEASTEASQAFHGVQVMAELAAQDPCIADAFLLYHNLVVGLDHLDRFFLGNDFQAFDGCLIFLMGEKHQFAAISWAPFGLTVGGH